MNPPPSEPFSFIFASLLSAPELAATVTWIVIIIILLICSALISGSEVAFFSLSAADLKSLEEDTSPAKKRVKQLLAKPSKLLATILICNNLVNIGIVILSAFTLDSIIDFSSMSPVIQFIIEVVIVTSLILLFGEVIPKVYAASNALNMAMLMTFPLVTLNKLFTPLSYVLVRGSEFLGKKIKPKSNQVSVDELEHALELTRDGETSEEEQKILEGIVKFGNIEVRQIMSPRTEVVAFDVRTEYATLLKKILETGYSRIPIYKDSFDEVVGTLYVKDLLPYADRTNFKWQTLVRNPFYIPENRKLDDLLKDFQEKKIHMAIVVDEYGGTSGIVTLEDVIEEIVGDITDEFDDDEINYSKLDDRNYVFEGKTLLVDFYRILDIDDDVFEAHKGEAETLAGFILELTGKIPKKNERVHFDAYTFTIEAADKRKIKQLKITLNNTVEK